MMLHLTGYDQKALNGIYGPATLLAMSILVQMAEIQEA
jgi:predicted aconitase